MSYIAAFCVIGILNVILAGLIREKNWYGPDGMEHARTKKTPQQSIPTFAETVALLMKASIAFFSKLQLLFTNVESAWLQEENRHITFDVDIKVYNEPNRLFSLMHTVISSQPDWENALAPRIVLGLWHPKFLEPAQRLLPYCKRSHIGLSPHVAREWFWDSCDGFSMAFMGLQTSEGVRFRNECKAAGKKLMVWTVNDPREMMEVGIIHSLSSYVHAKKY